MKSPEQTDINLSIFTQETNEPSKFVAAFKWDFSDFKAILGEIVSANYHPIATAQTRIILSMLLTQYNTNYTYYIHGKEIIQTLIEKKLIDHALLNEEGENILDEALRLKKWDLLALLLDDYILNHKDRVKLDLSQIFVECAKENRFDLSQKCLSVDIDLYRLNRKEKSSFFSFFSPEQRTIAMNWAIHHENYDFLQCVLNKHTEPSYSSQISSLILNVLYYAETMNSPKAKKIITDALDIINEHNSNQSANDIEDKSEHKQMGLRHRKPH